MSNSTIISVVIHTHNSSRDIEECITSAQLLTDSITVIDMESTDDTTKRAQQMQVPVFEYPFTGYVEPARKFGIDKAKTDWIFILDSDERLTPELASEIKNLITTPHNLQPITFYHVPRKNIFGKKVWLRHGGWWPDEQIRLIRKKDFETWPTEIHSTPKIKGAGGRLINSILHYFHGDLEEMVGKTIIFEDIESDLLFKAGKTGSIVTFFRKFLGELFRRLIKHRGFLDGQIGIIESVYQAYSKTVTYLFLYEKTKSRSL